MGPGAATGASCAMGNGSEVIGALLMGSGAADGLSEKPAKNRQFL